MAVVVRSSVAGVNPEIYSRMMEQLDLTGNPPAGLLLHVASFDEQGLHVTAVWNSEADFGAFAENRLMPATVSLGVTGERSFEVEPLHRIWSPLVDFGLS